ncbi:MAG: hypothetical protein Q9181_002884, partial [Wetmoreana brouardii]
MYERQVPFDRHIDPDHFEDVLMHAQAILQQDLDYIAGHNRARWQRLRAHEARRQLGPRAFEPDNGENAISHPPERSYPHAGLGGAYHDDGEPMVLRQPERYVPVHEAYPHFRQRPNVQGAEEPANPPPPGAYVPAHVAYPFLQQRQAVNPGREPANPERGNGTIPVGGDRLTSLRAYLADSTDPPVLDRNVFARVANPLLQQRQAASPGRESAEPVREHGTVSDGGDRVAMLQAYLRNSANFATVATLHQPQAVNPGQEPADPSRGHGTVPGAVDRPTMLQEYLRNPGDFEILPRLQQPRAASPDPELAEPDPGPDILPGAMEHLTVRPEYLAHGGRRFIRDIENRAQE